MYMYICIYFPLKLLSSYIYDKSVSTTELHYRTKKRKHSFSILKAFFVRHSSEYVTSDNDRKVNRNIKPDAGARDIMNNASIWPYDWPISTYSPLFT